MIRSINIVTMSGSAGGDVAAGGLEEGFVAACSSFPADAFETAELKIVTEGWMWAGQSGI